MSVEYLIMPESTKLLKNLQWRGYVIWVNKVLVTQSCPNFCDPPPPPRLLCPWSSPGKNTGVGRHFLLQGIFPTQGSNSGLLHCQWVFTTWACKEAVNSQMWNNLSMKLNILLDYNSKNKISISESSNLNKWGRVSKLSMEKDSK